MEGDGAVVTDDTLGDRVMVKSDFSVDFEKIDPNYKVKAYKTIEVGEDMARYRYAELCFVLDNLFGYPGRTLMEQNGLRQNGMDPTLEAVSGRKQVKQLLKSSLNYS